MARIAIVIVSYNTEGLLRECLESVRRHARGVECEAVVVDNASSDGSAGMVEREFPEARLIRAGANLGFGRANNLGVAESASELVLLLNSDAQLLENTPARLARFLDERPGAGAVGPGVILRDGCLQPRICGPIPGLRHIMNDSLLLSRARPDWFPGMHDDEIKTGPTAMGWISGVCMLVRREAYEAVGGFDPRFFMYSEDMDLCRKLGDAGWGIFHLPDTAIRHLCGGSSKSEAARIRSNVLQQRNFLLFLEAYMSRGELAAARALMGLGLLMRMGGAAALSLARGGDGRALLKSASLRLGELAGLPMALPGDAP